MLYELLSYIISLILLPFHGKRAIAESDVEHEGLVQSD